MEKRLILDSADHWRRMREVRHAFSHDYPESEAQGAQALNLAWHDAPELINIARNLETYTFRLHGIKLDDLP